MEKKNAKRRKPFYCLSKRQFRRITRTEVDRLNSALTKEGQVIVNTQETPVQCVNNVEFVGAPENFEQYVDNVEYVDAPENCVQYVDNLEYVDAPENCVQYVDNLEYVDALENCMQYVDNTKNLNDQALKEFICDWAIMFGISHKAISVLLKKLKEHLCFKNIPLDSRTLLKTPRSIITRPVSLGMYYHFGLQKAVIRILNSVIDSYNINDVIKITINIDGLPLFKASTDQFWPILGSIEPYKDVFIIGIYYGKEKCKDVNDFLKEFVLEASALCSEGIFIRSRHVKCKIHALICDSPARAYVMCSKGHSGYSSCCKCKTVGKYCNGRVCFPDIDAPKRTDQEFINKVDEDFHKDNITSALLNIPNFLPVSNVPLDYMHLICLGIMRRLIILWMSGDLKYRLQFRKQEMISTCLVDNLKKYIPTEFCRKPRSLKFVKLWKATEFRQILLYTGPIAFKESLRTDIYNHFMTLHVVIRIMCTEELFHLLDYAQELVRHFITSFSALYGIHSVSYNVHGLSHLVDDVKEYGTLDSFSCFKFENFLQTLKSSIRKPDKALEQIVCRYIEKENIFTPQLTMPSCNKFTINYKSLHDNGPLLSNCCNPQYRIITWKNITVKANTLADNCCGLRDGTIINIVNIATCKQTNIPVVIGYKVSKTTDFFSIPCPSSLLNIHLITNTSSNLISWPLAEILMKFVKLPYYNDFVVFPLLHSHN